MLILLQISEVLNTITYSNISDSWIYTHELSSTLYLAGQYAIENNGW